VETGAGQVGTPQNAPIDRSAGPVIANLQRTPSGARILTALAQHNVAIQVLDDSTANASLKRGAVAEYNIDTDTIFLRKSELAADPNEASSELAHEAVHALDAHTKKFAVERNAIAALRASGQTAAADQKDFEFTIDKEGRAYTIGARIDAEFSLLADGKPVSAVSMPADREKLNAIYLDMRSSAARQPQYNPNNLTPAQGGSFGPLPF
jgi:hypothetical protein